jgi:hypothetical protein
MTLRSTRLTLVAVIAAWALLTAPSAQAASSVRAESAFADRFNEKASDEPTVTERVRELPLREADEVLWLARCLYSETQKPREQRLVAWVVRNRVETEFRGKTYREVVLNPAQFSAFNRPSPRRRYILNLDLESPSAAWKQALDIAYEVYAADPDDRPFPITTRHFYSPISMSTGSPPHWTRDHEPIPASRLGIDSARFQFYDGIDRSEDQLAARVDRRSIGPAVEAREARNSGTSALRTLRRLRKKMRDRMNDVQIRRPKRPSVDRPEMEGGLESPKLEPEP